MEYRILGPLEVSADGEPLPLGPVKQRALLAVLLLNSGKTVSRDRLIDELWGDEPPKTAAKAVQNYVSRLRKLLPPETLLTRTPGYVAELAPGELDLDRFEQLVDEGRKALASGEAERSSALLREALGLWRGPALVEFEVEPFAQTEGLRLEELRLSALEERIEADLSLARHSELVGELEALVARHPLRERLCGQLMLALYRSGRQAEALTAYQDASATLVDELGIDPSRQLQDLERAILRQDSSLTLSELSLAERRSNRLDERQHRRIEHRQRATVEPRDRGRASAPSREKSETFVGRDAEIARLNAVLQQALDGHGQLVMLVGEAGIGKTRTAAELAASAEQMGALTYWGRCHEREGAPPFWPWVQAIRNHVRESDPSRLRTELGTSAPYIAEVISDVRERLPDLGPRPTHEDPKQARFRLFDAITEFLQSASSSQPLVLVLDDLHWADNDSLALLEFAAHELAGSRLLLIGTYRDVELSRSHPLSQTLAELTRDHLAERIPLRGLNAADIRRFIEANSGITPPTELVETVHTQTEGNPLFVNEIVRLLAQEGELTPEQLARKRRWSLGIPEGIREVIGRRLDRLSDRCNDVLTVAAVLGREFSLGQLSSLFDDLPDERLLEVLEDALAARVIEELPHALERYQFTHALIREVIEHDLSASRRRRLHAEIARALEDLYGAEAEAHAAELAYHYAEAEAVLGIEKLVHYSLLAGERALSAYAYEEAIAYFERALSAKEGQPTDAEAAELLFGLGRAQLAALEAQELGQAATNVARAFEYYVDAGDLDRAIEVAAHPILPSWPLSQTELVGVVNRALEFVPGDSREEGHLLTTHGWFLGAAEADYEGARRALDRALAISERTEDAALQRSVLGNAARIDWLHLRLDSCLESAARLSELVERDDDDRGRLNGGYAMTRALTSAGRCQEARSHAAATLAAAERLRDGWWLAGARSGLSILSALEGDWQEARRLSDLALASQPNDPRLLGPRAVLEYEVGEFQNGTVYIERMQEAVKRYPPPGPLGEYGFASVFIPSVGLISGSDEHNQFAETTAKKLLSLPYLAPHWRVLAQSGLGLLAAQSKQTIAVDSLYSALKPQRGTFIPYTYLAADRLLGLLALRLGRAETAAVHFQDALAFCDRAGCQPEYAWTAFDYAEALLAPAAHGDPERAVGLYDEACAIARELGMRPLLERALSHREVSPQ